MKLLLHLLVFGFLFSLDGQRRSANSELLSENEPVLKSARRGRSRFTVTSEVPAEEPRRLESGSRRASFRRRPEPATEATKRGYEVSEAIDDIPFEKFRRTKVLTENKFEAQNAPPSNALFQPATTENLEDVIKSIGSDISSSSTIPSSSEPEISSSELTKVENDISRSPPETTTPLAPRRSNGRTRIQTTSLPASSSVRSRGRGRPTKKPEEVPTFPSRTAAPRSSRRRIEPSAVPPVPNNSPVRGRTESRRKPTTEAPVEVPQTRRRNLVASRRNDSPVPERIEVPNAQRLGVRRNPETSTFASRSRGRPREVPPIIDEQKLEVLPLFERESKPVRPSRLSRRRSFEDVQTSATENHVQIVPKVSVSVETRSESSITRRRFTNKPRTTKGTSPSSTKKRPLIKESVVSEITEVTSKRTVPRNQLKPSRGNKKSEVKLEKNKSEEEIDDSDNYPESFKALIQAKKYNKKESRPLQRPVSITKKVVNSLPSSTTEANPQIEDFENELVPSKAPPTRRRFNTTRKAVFVRSTTAQPLKDHKFHAKFNTESETTTSKPVKVRSFTPKASRGLYSSRKANDVSKSKTTTTQIPIPKKSNRFSSRYRNDASARGAIRTSTNAPAYLPTIPTVTPSTTPVKSTYQDKDLGVEVISFDDPVNTIPSANLVNGEFVSSSTENQLTNSLVPMIAAKGTEKPVSIIERIINSITAISTTEQPAKLTTPPIDASTKASAILKLATKKPNQTTQTIPTVTVTSERPTTIIERILSSLSAIQADNGTDHKTLKSFKQVGSNFNTISSPATTPISRVTKSAQFSTTSLDPVSVYNDISNDQTLQRRTIDKLLGLLNSLMTSTPQTTPLVVVTPKTTNFIGASSTVEVASTETPAPENPLFTTTRPETTSVRFTVTPTTVKTQESTTLNLLSNEISTTEPVVSTITESTPSTTDSSTSTAGTTEFTLDQETPFVFPSTIPALINFEVSPGSVSVFSANDLSNLITPDDSLSTTTTTTVTISNKSSNQETTITTPTLESRFADPSLTTTSSTSTTSSPSTTTIVANSTTTDSSSNSSTTTSTTSSPGTTTQPIDIVSSNSTTVDSSNSSTSTMQPMNISTSTVNPSNSSSRAGRLLDVVQEPVQNSIESTTLPDKDFFIFAILNNNTILRKRPSRFPNKDAPFLIVGVYPNNTIVKRFPNGTMVPMEPVIRVSGFDTRPNPPPLAEITSNQVTPDQESRPDNKTLQTVDQNTIPPFEANALSITPSNSSTTGAVPTSTIPPETSSSSTTTTTENTIVTSTISTTSSTTTSAPVTTSTISTATLPTLNEILNGRTVKAFNSIINISDLTKTKTLEVDPKTNKVLNTDKLQYENDVIYRWRPVTSSAYLFKTTTTTTLPTLSNRILDDPTTQKIMTTTTTPTIPPTTTQTIPPTTTPSFTTTTNPPTTTPLPPKPTTVVPLTQPATTTFRTTTFLPNFLTTLLSTFRPSRISTEPPLTIVTPISNKVQPTTTTRGEFTTVSNELVTASSTRRTVRTRAPITTTVPTTRANIRRRVTTTVPTTTTSLPTTTTPITTTNIITTTTSTTESVGTTTSATKRLRELTDQQRKDLATLAQLEMEQAALLRQLSFFTNFQKLGNAPTTTSKDDLANRVIALAVERAKEKEKTTTLPTTTTTENNRQPKKLSTDKDSINELVKQFNVAAPATVSTEYGSSNDAIIAAILKEQGIRPTTPKSLEDIYSLTTTTRRSRPRTTTTPPPGPLMRSLNWLLNVLAPPTTKKPKTKTKPKPKPKPKENQDELLTHQPTHITPVVTQAPRANSLSQDEIQKLIKQLEGIQKDPTSSKSLDLTSIQSLQGLLNIDEGVKVTSSGTSGTTTREVTTVIPTTKRKGKSRSAKSTTALPVSNSITEEIVPTTEKVKLTLPPVKLRAVPGIEESDTLVRGQLITAAVNVTRALSSFLGTALQDAARQLTRSFSSGSSNLKELFGSSSVLSHLANSSAT